MKDRPKKALYNNAIFVSSKDKMPEHYAIIEFG